MLVEAAAAPSDSTTLAPGGNRGEPSLLPAFVPFVDRLLLGSVSSAVLSRLLGDESALVVATDSLVLRNEAQSLLLVLGGRRCLSLAHAGRTAPPLRDVRSVPGEGGIQRLAGLPLRAGGAELRHGTRLIARKCLVLGAVLLGWESGFLPVCGFLVDRVAVILRTLLCHHRAANHSRRDYALLWPSSALCVSGALAASASGAPSRCRRDRR